MKNLFCLIGLTTLLFSTLCSTSSAAEQDDSLFQYSTINALLNGYYDGDMHFATLAAHGDMGLGTFNHLAGEMIGLDGKLYQIKTDGIAYPVDGNRYTPFAVVTHFDVDQSVPLPGNLDYPGLQQALSQLITNHNHFYAFRIRGSFHKITVRSVPAQTPPYRPLAEVIKEQVKFQYTDQEGTLVGFYTPDYMNGLNVPGYHFHFLNADHSRGGHVLALETEAGKIEIDEISEILMTLPKAHSFAELELARDQKTALDKVEKNTPPH